MNLKWVGPVACMVNDNCTHTHTRVFIRKTWKDARVGDLMRLVGSSTAGEGKVMICYLLRDCIEVKYKPIATALLRRDCTAVGRETDSH